MISKKFLSLQNNFGGLAHLARALDWQSKGGRFDPDILHQCKPFFAKNGFFDFFTYF